MSCMKKPELIGPLLGYCNHRAYQRMEQKLRRYGVTPIQCRSLTYLHRLTEAGQQFYDDFESITRQIEDLIHRGMDPQETETLRRLLLRAADNLTSEEDNA